MHLAEDIVVKALLKGIVWWVAITHNKALSRIFWALMSHYIKPQGIPLADL